MATRRMDWATRERLWRLQGMLTLVLDEMSDIHVRNDGNASPDELDQLSDVIDNLAVARDEMTDLVTEPEGCVLMNRRRS